MTDNCGFRIDSDDNLTLCDGTENFVEDSEAGEQGNDTTACNPADAVENEDVILTPLKLFTIGEDDEDNEIFDNIDNNNFLRSPRRDTIQVERSVFSQSRFDGAFTRGRRPAQSLQQRAIRKLSKYFGSCSHVCCKVFVFNLFPFLTFMKDYSIRKDFSGDIISGLTVGIMHIPQGMAYGILTTLPPVYGLYMSFFPVLVYFFFGSSKHISVGTFSVACLMIGTAVTKGYANSKPDKRDDTTVTNITDSVSGAAGSESMSQEELSIRLSYALSLTFVVGILQLLMGIARLGFVTVYLSDPLISGFTTGAACHVYTSQIKNIFGVETKQYSGALKLIYTYRDFFNNLGTQIKWAAFITSIISLILLYSVTHFINHNRKFRRKMFMPVPIELIVIILGTLISYFAQLKTNFKVDIVGDVPTGFQRPEAPFKHIGEVVPDAVAIAIVVFAVSISMAKILAKKLDYEVDANQELIAFGFCNIVSSFLAAPVSSASMSRSLTQERGGGKTQVAGLVSCVLLLIVLLAIGPYFRTLPNCVLAAIIMEKMRGMLLQARDLKILWNISLTDFFVWIVSFFATVLLDVDSGLGVAVGFAILTTVWRSQRPYMCRMGRIPGTDIYLDASVYKKAKEIPGIKIIRCEYSLLFANAEYFKTRLYKMTVNPRKIRMVREERERRLGINCSTQLYKGLPNGGFELEIPSPTEVSDSPTESMVSVIGPAELLPDCDLHTMILDCSSWSFVDTVGIEALMSVIAEYKNAGLHFYLANCKDGITETFEKAKFYTVVDRSDVFVSLHDAVQRARFDAEPSPQVVTEASSVVTLEGLNSTNDTQQLISGNSTRCNGFLRLNYSASQFSQDV